MGFEHRLPLYEELQQKRGRNVIAYVTTRRAGVDGRIAGDVLPEFMDQLERLPVDANGVDLLVVSNGGDPTVAYRIVTLIRERVEKLAVLVPQAAFSAATLLACGADEILMHPNGNLGPVDPQLVTVDDNGKRTQFAAEDVTSFIQFARDDVGLTEQPHTRELLVKMCEEVGAIRLGLAARSRQSSVFLGEKLLGLHMDREGESSGQQASPKASAIAETLSKEFFNHGHAVGRNEAAEIGLPVHDPGDEVNDLMWRIWSDFSEEMSCRQTYNPMSTLAASPEWSKLTGPIPQMTLPGNGPGIPANQIAQQFLAQNTVTIQPVDEVLPVAFVESTSCASRNVEKRKIQARREIDLSIRCNVTPYYSGWETTFDQSAQSGDQ